MPAAILGHRILDHRIVDHRMECELYRSFIYGRLRGISCKVPPESTAEIGAELGEAKYFENRFPIRVGVRFNSGTE